MYRSLLMRLGPFWRSLSLCAGHLCSLPSFIGPFRYVLVSFDVLRSLLKVSFPACTWLISLRQISFVGLFCRSLFMSFMNEPCLTGIPQVPFEGLFPYMLVTFAAFLRLLVPFDKYWSLLMCLGLFWRSLSLSVGRLCSLPLFIGSFRCVLVSFDVFKSLLKVSFPMCWSPLQPSFVYWSLSICLGLLWCV